MDLVETRVNTGSDNRHPWEEARFDFFIKKIEKYIDLRQPICIYDIGCGDAYFITKLCNTYPNITGVGIDINFTAEDITLLGQDSKHHNLHLFNNIEDAYKAFSNVTLILLMDVIEHIEDDVVFLQTLVAPIVEKNNTVVFITVPAYQSLFTRHDIFLKHFRRYNNKSLLNSVQKAGLTKVEMGYFFFVLLPLRFIEKVRDKISPKDVQGLANWNKGTVVTKVIKSILLLDISISGSLKKIGINLPGLSNYIVCKK